MHNATLVNLDNDSHVSKDHLAINSEEEKNPTNLYQVEDKPSFIFSVLNAIQICGCQLLSVLWLPLLLTPALCILPAEPVRVQLVSSALFTSGVISLLQSAVGIRLPTVVAPSVVYASSLISLLQSPAFKCPSNGDLYAMGPLLRAQEWQTRLREVQGVLLFIGGLHTLLAVSGLLALLASALKPAVLTTTVILCGISFIQEPMEKVMENCTLSSLSIPALLMMVFCGLRDMRLPLPTFSRQSGLKFEMFYIFRMFPVLWTCLLSYILYWATSTSYKELYYQSEEMTGFEEAVDNASRFYIPHPFEWGLPSLSMNSVLHVLPAFILQAATTIMTFHANANACDAGGPPRRCVSRGLAVEGVGLMLGSLWGHAVATSPSGVGLTYITGIASRRCTLLAALLMICVSFSTAFIFMIANIPTMFLVVIHIYLHSGLVCIGISMLNFTNLYSRRNPVIIGVSLLFGLILPRLMASNHIAVGTGFPMLDNFTNQCLKSAVFVGMSTSCLLDLLMPGKASSSKSCLKGVKTDAENHIYRLPSWQEFFCKVLDQADIFSVNSK